MRVFLICAFLLMAPMMGMVGFKIYERVRDEQATQAAVGWHPRSEVLFFNASWCGPCRQMKPIVTQMRGQGYRMRDIDIDQNRALAQKYGVRSIPTFVFIQNGSEVNRFSGGTSPENLRKLCASRAYH